MKKIIRDKIFSVRITQAQYDRVMKKYKSFIPFLDLCLELDEKGILKPLDRALYEIKQDSTGSYLNNLKRQINNHKASNEWEDSDEPNDSLDKQVQQLREK